jgi:glutamate transport system substrate-binding protein
MIVMEKTKSERTAGISRGWMGLASVLAVAAMFLGACAPSVGGGGGGGGGQTDDTTPGAPGKFEADSTMANIQKRGRLIVGLVLDNPPFAARNANTGSIEGFDVEVAKLFAVKIFGDQIENKVQFVQVPVGEEEAALQNNRADIVMGRYAITVARKKLVDFAGPYYVAHQDVAAARFDDLGSVRISSLLDLSGRKVCVVKKSTDIAALQAQAPGVDASLVVDTVQQCALAVRNRTAVAMAADYVDLQSVFAANDFAEIGQFDPTPYGIGVRKGTTDFRQWLNDMLDNGDVKSGWQAAYARTVGVTGASDQQPPVDRY